MSPAAEEPPGASWQPGVLMVLGQGGEGDAAPAAGGQEPEVPPGREDGAGAVPPSLRPAPGVEAAGTEERRACGCCSGMSWPCCGEAPGEEGESGRRGRGGSIVPAGLPALGVTLPGGGPSARGGGAWSGLGRLQRAPGTGARPAAGRSRLAAFEPSPAAAARTWCPRVTCERVRPRPLPPAPLARTSRPRWRSQRAGRHDLPRAPAPCPRVPGAARAGCPVSPRPGAGTAPAPLILRAGRLCRL